MTGRRRVFLRIAIALAALAVIVAVTAIGIVQTDWFRNYLTKKIIAATEEATGGRVEIGSFRFEWRHMLAEASEFVIHGSEPPDVAPLLRAPRVQVRIRLFTSIHHIIDVAYVGIDGLQANIVVMPDGHSNIPSPKPSPASGNPPLQSIVDAAIGRFDLNNATIVFADARQALDLHASNLHAQLWYQTFPSGYKGELSFQPLYVASGGNTPVAITMTLPVSIQSDRISLEGATIATAQSRLRVDGSIENLRSPKLSAHVSGQIALADLRNPGNLPLRSGARDVPAAITLDAEGVVSANAIRVTRLRVDAGHTYLEASGDLQGGAGLNFTGQAALGEIGRLTGSALPEGQAGLSGTMKFDAAAVTLSALRVEAFGAVLRGDASLQDFDRYQVHGDLGNLTLATAAALAGSKPLSYAGAVNGPIQLSGDLANSHTLKAQAELSITPLRGGIPVSGRLSAAYDRAADDLRVTDSYLALPHSRVTVNGIAGKELDVMVSTSDLGDLTPLGLGAVPVDLHGHSAQFTGTVTGGLTSGRVAGRLRAESFSVEGRSFDSLALDASATGSGLSVANAEVARQMMRAQFSGRVGMHSWKLSASEPLTVDAALRSGDVADVLAFAGQPVAGSSGALTANVQIRGTVGNPLGSADLTALHGAVRGEPFDQISAHVALSDRLIEISQAEAERGGSRVTLAAQLHHPAESFTSGELHAHVESARIDLAQLQTLQQQRPNTGGSLGMNVDVSAQVGPSEVRVTDIGGTVNARALQFDGQDFGDIAVDARTAGQTVQYQISSTFAGSAIRASGGTQLQPGYASTLDATVSNLPVDRVLAAAKRTDIPVKGRLAGTAHFSGTASEPTGSVDLSLAGGVLYDEPVDSVRAKATYAARKASLEQLDLVVGGSRIGATAEFDHPLNDLKTGTVQFHLNGSNVNLARLHTVQARQPGLGGVLTVAVDGSGELPATGPKLSLRNLKGSVALTGVTRQNQNLGDATLTADMQGDKINFVLASNLAGANIQGRGSAQPDGDYPLDAQLSFSNLAWNKLRDVVAAPAAAPSDFDAAADGAITVQGPAADLDRLRGSVRLTRLELTSAKSKNVALKNQEPIALTLHDGTIQIDSAHMSGAQSDLQAKGSFSVKDRSMNLTLAGNADLAVLQTLDRDISSSGTAVLAATIRGNTSKPALSGNLQLKNVFFNHTQFSNGISNANGTVVFNGAGASLRNFTAESGGGKVAVTGSLLLSENPRVGLRVTATGVRMEVQQGVSVVTDATLDLTGTRDASSVSGRATVTRINYAPRTDLGSILTRAAPSVEGGTAPSPLLDNMKLNVQIQTSDALAVQSSLAQSLQGTANLQVRGTASRPSVLGRITLTEGSLIFFGATYTVNSGTIAFYNPVRIEPVLDVNLQTNAEGVDVTLRVTGPVENLKLSYTSDPPLQFEEILGLLASGKTPTSDPTLLANNPPQQQSVSEMGESAVLGNALANPVANRLQRVFGVTQLKINPAFTNGSTVPDATLSLKQQIAKNITFTYVTSVDNANAQTIRVEVTLNPEWSAAAMRDENGIFSVNLLYKRQFR